MFTGGLRDRYGYKETIFASTVVKISGYLVMAFFPTFYGFFAGAILLATGTAIFKPGIQGTLVKSTKRENSSMALGHLLPDRQHRRLPRPARRRVHAQARLAQRLPRLRRHHLP